MTTLIIETGSGPDLTFEIDKDSISIGASSTNDVVLRAPGVAPSHLVIRRGDGRFTFLGQQRQVVLLNGDRRSRGVIEEGDKIRIGTASLLIREDVAGAAEELEVQNDLETRESPTGAAEEPVADASRPRAEVVLFNEPTRLAEGRRGMLELFSGDEQTDMVAALERFFDGLFPGRKAMLAWLDQQGRLQPIAANWTGAIPQLPSRTFEELDFGDRVAVLRGGSREVVIYPVPAGGTESRVYLFAETEEEDLEEDRILIAELAGMLATNWQGVSSSSELFGKWESDAREKIDRRMPGTSAVIRTLREEVLAAARSAYPVLLCGPPGSGRAYLGSLIAALRPTGRPWVRIVQVRGGDDQGVNAELFGSETAPGARGLAEHAGGGVVVLRDIHRMSVELQRETAAAIAHDLGTGYGSKVRWILTADEEIVDRSAGKGLDESLLDLVSHHFIRVPPFEERREDLPLLIVRMLESVGAEQGKAIRGIELDTLDSLLSHTFTGEMTELLGELRRLVSATPEGEMVRGTLKRSVGRDDRGGKTADDAAATSVLGEDDLKVVIPAVEKLLIDRVLRRALGNQSKAARELNLSRGALIAKIKEYDIPDYRSLRRARK